MSVPAGAVTTESAPRNYGSGRRLSGLLAVVAALGLASFVADFAHFRRLGLFWDDWWQFGGLLRPGMQGFWQTGLDSLGFYRVMQPLAFAVIWLGYRVAGLAGCYLCLWLVTTANAAMVFAILRRRWPVGVAFLAALVFELYPADNTHLWLSCIVPRLGMLLVLLAIDGFCRGRIALCALLATASLLLYEQCFLQFALAAFLCPGHLGRNSKRCLAVMGPILLVYVVWRATILPLYFNDYRVNGLASRGKRSVAKEYVKNVASAPVLMLVSTQADALAGLSGWKRGVLVLPAALAALAFGVACPRRLQTALHRALGWREGRPAAFRRRLQPRGPCEAVVANDVVSLLGLAAIGCVGILVGAALSFSFPPCGDLWSYGSRANYCPSLGAALVMAAAFGIWGRLASRRTRSALVLPVVVVYISAILLFRTCIQSDFASAARIQADAVSRVSKTMRGLAPGSVLVLTGLPSSPAFPRPLMGTPSETNGIARALRGSDVQCWSSDWILAENDQWMWFGNYNTAYTTVPALPYVAIPRDKVTFLELGSEG